MIGSIQDARLARRLLVMGLVLVAAGTHSAALPAAAGTEAMGAQAAAASWPHTIEHDGASVTVYQPQAISWPQRKRLTARAALSITRPGQPKPLLGTIELTLATRTDEAAGVVSLSDAQLVSSHFPALDTAHAAELEGKLRVALQQMQIRQVPLASVLLSLKQLPVEAVKVSNEPPVIFYAAKPASLVVFDGEPVLVPAGKSGLSYAVNTNWQVFNDGTSWYLLNNGIWFQAASVGGPFAPLAKLPDSFAALKKDPAFAAVARSIPARVPAAEGARAADLRQPEARGDHRHRRTDQPARRRRHRAAAHRQHLQHAVLPACDQHLFRAAVRPLVLGACPGRAVGVRHRQTAAGFRDD